MKYPDDFNTPAFPAGKFVAVSRFMATLVMILFVAIIALCGFLMWANKTRDINPLLVSYTLNGEPWAVVSSENHATEIPATYVLQESMLNKFVHHWFTISENFDVNAAVWSTGCNRQSPECTSDENSDIATCAIYCACDSNVFADFTRVVLPIYSNLETEYNAIWTVQNVSIAPVDSIDVITKNHGGLWKFNVSVQTNMGLLNFTGFARTGRNINEYPKTMGYYVADFKTYRLN